jgi:hypothetical protein
VSALTDLTTYRRLRDANGLRLYEEEIARNEALLEAAKLTRKRTRLRLWLKLARLKVTDDGSWERGHEIKHADIALSDADNEAKGHIRFLHSNIERIRRLYQELAATVAQDGAA